MRVHSALLPAIIVVLVLTVGAGAAASADAATAAGGTDLEDADHQDFEIALTDDGDAEWTVTSYFLLADDGEVAEFEEFAAAVEEGSVDGQYDQESFERFTRFAEERTDREMEIEDAGWKGSSVRPVEEVDAVDGDDFDDELRVGSLSYEVTWTNFGAVDGDRMELADTFLTDEGTWFPRLDDGQRLLVEPPENHDFVTIPHGLDDGRLVWEGPHEFGEDDFDIVLEFRGERPGGSTLAGSWLTIFGGAVVLATLGGSLWYLFAYRGDKPEGTAPPASVDAADSSSTSASAGDETGESDPAAADPTGESEAASAGASGAASAGASGAGATGDAGDTETARAGDATTDGERDEIDPELLSDEERIHRMLERNGGRMKQATIVTETGWSNAKVSQLLSKMDDDGEIEKLRIGRENLITLPEVDPTQVE